MCSYFFLFKKTLLLRITRHILNFEVSECVSTKQEQHTPCTRTVLRLLSLLVVQEQPSWPAEESTLTKQRQTERAPTSSQTGWKQVRVGSRSARWCYCCFARLFSKQNQTKQFLSQFSSAGVRSFIDIVNNDAKKEKLWITL